MQRSAEGQAHLKAHSLANLDRDMPKTSESNDSNLHARLVQPVVHQGAVDGDASTQQGGGSVQRQVLGDVQHEAAGSMEQSAQTD